MFRQENKTNSTIEDIDLENIQIETMKDDLRRAKERKKNHQKNVIPSKIIKENLSSSPPKKEQSDDTEIKADMIPPLKNQDLPPEKAKKNPSPFLTSSSAEEPLQEKKPALKETPETVYSEKNIDDNSKNLPQKQQENEDKQKKEFFIDNLLEKRMETNSGNLKIKESEKDKTSWVKLLFLSVLFFFGAVLAAATYYLWATNQIKPLFRGEKKISEMEFSFLKEKNTPTPPPSKSKEKEIKPPKEKISLSKDKPNYLNIEISALSKAEIRSKLEKMAQEVISSGFYSPIEFVVSDEKNNPISFKDFSEKMEIGFSPEFMEKIDGEFSLFIYPNENNPRLGLAVKLKESNISSEDFLKEEPEMAKKIEILFLAENYTIENRPFSNGKYKEIPVRYINISLPEDLSVDYTIFKNQFLIGTSQMTLREIIDYFETQSDATEE